MLSAYVTALPASVPAPSGAVVMTVDARLLAAISITALACASAALVQRLLGARARRARAKRPAISIARRHAA